MVIQYPTKSGIMLAGDQMSELMESFYEICQEIASRKSGGQPQHVHIHLGYGIWISMSPDWENVSIRRWMPQDKAEFLGKDTYTDQEGVTRKKHSVLFKEQMVVAGGNFFF
mgnify:CR=1 FL=1